MAVVRRRRCQRLARLRVLLAALPCLVVQGVPLAEWERPAIACGLQRSVQPRTERDAWLQAVLGVGGGRGPAEGGR